MTARAVAFNTELQEHAQRNAAFTQRSRPLMETKRSAASTKHSNGAVSLIPQLNPGGLGGALAMGSNALPGALCWHACVMHMGGQLFCLSPWHRACFAWQNQIAAESTVHLWARGGLAAIRLLPAAERAGEIAEHPSDDELARSMDLALGERGV